MTDIYSQFRRKERPWPPKTIMAKFHKSATVGGGRLCTEKQASYIASLMGSAFSDSSTLRQDRLAILSWLTGRHIESTANLTFGEASAILRWIIDKKTGALHDMARAELTACLVPAMRHAGQLSLVDWDNVPEVIHPDEIQIFYKNACEDV